MLDLDQQTVEELKSNIVEDDEEKVREMCGLKKNASKYPIQYKEVLGGSLSSSNFVNYMAICLKSDTKGCHSLLIKLDDGRWTRICSGLLKEMQETGYGVVENENDQDSLFE